MLLAAALVHLLPDAQQAEGGGRLVKRWCSGGCFVFFEGFSMDFLDFLYVFKGCFLGFLGCLSGFLGCFYCLLGCFYGFLSFSILEGFL